MVYIRVETEEESQLYQYIQDLAQLPSEEALHAFHYLLWEGRRQPGGELCQNLRTVLSLDSEREQDNRERDLNVINRCYYTICNPWHMDSSRHAALKNLILWLEHTSATPHPDSATEKLRFKVLAYRESNYFEILKRHQYLLEDKRTIFSFEQTPSFFRDYFPHYFFIYEAGTKMPDQWGTEDAGQGVILQRNHEAYKLGQALNVYYVRRNQGLGDRAAINPTLLQDHILDQAINLYRPNRDGSFRKRAHLFQLEEPCIRTVRDYKEAVHRHIISPLRNLTFEIQQWLSHLFKRTLDAYSMISENAAPYRMHSIRIFEKLFDVFFRYDKHGLDGTYFKQNVQYLGPQVITSILLNIILSCPMARHRLEKHFTTLYQIFADTSTQKLQWLIDSFEHMNVASALNAKYIGYFNRSTSSSSMIPDSI